MNTLKRSYYQTPIAELVLVSTGSALCMCNWSHKKTRERVDNRLKKYFNAEYEEAEDDILRETQKQLEEYFCGERKGFDLPLAFAGTEFQLGVWRELQTIPFAQTASYQDLAYRLKKPKAVRAVANANGANALSIIVPCHRIIGSNGSLTGYAGGLDIKEFLLNHERQFF